MTYPPTPTQPTAPTAVLVVEDDATTAFVLQKILQRAGYQVTTAGSFGQALDAARNHPFHVLISDLTLPDGHGHDLLAELLTIQPGIRGIALSGHGAESDLRNSREAGFVEHLVKPVDLATLEAAIARVTAPPAA